MAVVTSNCEICATAAQKSQRVAETASSAARGYLPRGDKKAGEARRVQSSSAIRGDLPSGAEKESELRRGAAPLAPAASSVTRADLPRCAEKAEALRLGAARRGPAASGGEAPLAFLLLSSLRLSGELAGKHPFETTAAVGSFQEGEAEGEGEVLLEGKGRHTMGDAGGEQG